MAADPVVEHKRSSVRPDKAEVVAELTEAFRASQAAVLTEYRGLSVKQLTALRVALGADTTYAVVKNTLTTLAAREAGLEGLEGLLSGPTAVAFVNGDPVEAAKSLRDFGRTNPQLVVKGGVMDGRTLSVDDVRKLADLESREVLLAKLAGALLASLSQAVYLLNAPLAQAARLAGALQQKATEDPSVIGGAGSPSRAASASDGGEDVPGVTSAGSNPEEPPGQGTPPATADEGITPAETDPVQVDGADSSTDSSDTPNV